MKSRQEIKQIAKTGFKNNYWTNVGWITLAMVIFGLTSNIPVVGYLSFIALVPVLVIGLSYFNLVTYRNEKAGPKELFAGFSNKFGHYLGGYYWMSLWVFLWSMLFIIPGIIKGYSYFFTPYILIDQPEISATDALKLSMKMTDGYKGEIFVMQLSFLGWMLLAAITFGIFGLFYTYPYSLTTYAGFYEERKLTFNADNTPVPEPA